MRPSGTPLTKPAAYLRRPLPESWTDLPPSPQTSRILRGLNEAQRAAVTSPATVVQILAPPGSGKTRTLTSRVAYLLSEPNCMTPENVIVATFTVKAAAEMKERLSKLVGEGIERRLVLGTFHSIARRYLLKYGGLIGLKPGWGIADAADTKAICSRIIKRRKLGDVIDPKKLQSRISHFKARNLSPRANEKPLYSSARPSTQATQQQQRDIATEDFVMLYDDYHTMLGASNILDYDDLLLKCLEMLKAFPECVSNIETVLIDEFQDTNIVQYELMRYLAWKHKRVTIVGDPDQSIYGFRAAEISNLKRMRRLYPDTVIINLEQNYRSSASILSAALEVIIQDKARPEKPLVATHAIGPSPVLRRVPNPYDEAKWIVGEIKRIQALTAEMVKPSGIAILVRSSPLTRVIEQALARERVPYRMVGGTRFFDRAEVKVVIDYLRVLQNPANNDAVVRVVNVPSRKVGASTVKALLEEAERKKKTLWELICRGVRGDTPWSVNVSKPAEKGLGIFTAMMLGLTKKLDDVDGETTLPEIMNTVLEKICYEDFLQRTYPEDFDSRWANVAEVISQAQEASTAADDEFLPEIEGLEQHIRADTPRLALERFLANVALVNERKAEDSTDEGGEVTISTIHAAKGLEWPVVFIPAVYEGSIPHSRAEDIDEERRLLYVAMTRAQALLYMSCPFRTQTSDKMKLSQFVDWPRVLRVVEKKAPELRFSTVQTLAAILGQPCPREMQIEECVARRDLVWRLDDRVPDKDTEEKEPNAEGEEDRTETRPTNRGRWNNEATFTTAGHGPITTEDKLRGKLTTAQKIGFQTAASHLTTLQSHGNITCEADQFKRQHYTKTSRTTTVSRTVSAAGKTGFKPPSLVQKTFTTESHSSITTTTKSTITTTTSRGAAKLTKVAKSSSNQGKLTSFFTKKPPPPKPPNATEIINVVNKTDMTLKEQIAALPQPVIPKRPADDFLLLSSSPVKPAKKRRQLDTELPSSPLRREVPRRGRPVVLPSSPTRLAEMKEEVPPSSPVLEAFRKDLEEQRVAALEGLPDMELPHAEHHEISRASEVKMGVKEEDEPELPALQPLKGLYSPPKPYQPYKSVALGKTGRKTLGVRRTGGGWADRKHK